MSNKNILYMKMSDLWGEKTNLNRLFLKQHNFIVDKKFIHKGEVLNVYIRVGPEKPKVEKTEDESGDLELFFN